MISKLSLAKGMFSTKISLARGIRSKTGAAHLRQFFFGVPNNCIATYIRGLTVGLSSHLSLYLNYTYVMCIADLNASEAGNQRCVLQTWILLKLAIRDVYCRLECPWCWKSGLRFNIRLIVRSRDVLKLRDWLLKLLQGSEIWQAPRQQCCRGACQISKLSHNSKYKSRDFDTLRYLTVGCAIVFWKRAQRS